MNRTSRNSSDWCYLILELGQEQRQQVLHCVVFAQDSGQAHDDRGQGRFHMLVGVRHQFLSGEKESDMSVDRDSKSSIFK
jgi:hypothetical protein